ncbi:hypothetical protein [Maribacter sp. 2307UL18-2]|uniref:hypothetical protein n=1 Tax=Maribacter sp. 2307UL18-2 TaxID=3386274 RepID=UPI0039BC6963
MYGAIFGLWAHRLGLLIIAGREKKGQAALRRLFFRAVPRGSGKPKAERLPERTGEACSFGEDWNGRFAPLPQGQVNKSSTSDFLNI